MVPGFVRLVKYSAKRKICRKSSDSSRIGRSGSFKYRTTDLKRKAQNSLRTQPPERKTGPFGPAGSHLPFRSGMAYSLPYADRQVCSGRASHVPFAGRAADATEYMTIPHYAHETERRTVRRSSARPRASRRPQFTSRVHLVHFSSLPEVNSQTARRRVDTSLSSLGSLRSARYHRHVEPLAAFAPLPLLSEPSELGELRGRVGFPSVDFVSSLRFTWRSELSELGGEL